MTKARHAEAERHRAAGPQAPLPADLDGLDEALAATFPSSDPVASQQPVVAGPAPDPTVATANHAEEAQRRAKTAGLRRGRA